jgi:hypothetical protein
MFEIFPRLKPLCRGKWERIIRGWSHDRRKMRKPNGEVGTWTNSAAGGSFDVERHEMVVQATLRRWRIGWHTIADRDI